MLAEILNYIADKPAFLLFSFWGIVVLTAGTVLTIIYLLLIRAGFLLRRYQHRSMVDEWSPVFRQLRKELEPANYPPISRAQKRLFLETWLKERRHASATFASALDALAGRLALGNSVLDILRPGAFDFLPRQVWLQSTALEVAVFINNKAIRQEIVNLSESEDEAVAVQACSCMARLKMKGHERKIIALMFRFPGRITGIFDQLAAAGGASVLHTVRPFLSRLPENTVINFIQFTEMSGDSGLLPVIEERLAGDTSDEEKAALLRALGALGDIAQRKLCIPFLKHEKAFVRIQAATSLGEIGIEEDIELLKPLLWDQGWWVRYRSAQAILQLLNFDEENFEKLRDEQEDQYAREILVHAYEEHAWHLI